MVPWPVHFLKVSLPVSSQWPLHFSKCPREATETLAAGTLWGSGKRFVYSRFPYAECLLLEASSLVKQFVCLLRQALTSSPGWPWPCNPALTFRVLVAWEHTPFAKRLVLRLNTMQSHTYNSSCRYQRVFFLQYSEWCGPGGHREVLELTPKAQGRRLRWDEANMYGEYGK